MSQSDEQSEVGPPILSPQASLVLIYRPTAVGMKGWIDFAQTGNRTGTCWSMPLSLGNAAVRAVISGVVQTVYKASIIAFYLNAAA
ncbi:hypothetical protein TNCV_2233511 [Trichonephila clavipes]|nr:hypothetical protein TNCV_2233511 [Trichonephila clavipes]